MLQRNRHYAPLRADFSDLCATVTELRRAPARAAALAAAAANFTRAVLSPAAVRAYVVALLRGYAALQTFRPRRHPKATRWRPGGAPRAAKAGARRGGPRVPGGRCTSSICCHRHPRAEGCTPGGPGSLVSPAGTQARPSVVYTREALALKGTQRCDTPACYNVSARETSCWCGSVAT